MKLFRSSNCSLLALLVAVIVVAAACGSTSTETGTTDDADPGTDETTEPTTEPDDAAADDHDSSSDEPDDDDPPADPADDAPAEPGAVEVRSFEFDGASVTVRSTLDELPEQATVVAFTSTLIDSGSGLELCLGGVAESLPPQCSGPVVTDLDPTGWTETTSGVTWGERTIEVAWPPNDDGTLTLISDREAVRPEPFDDFDFSTPPAECTDIENSVDAEVVAQFADANRDRTGTVWVVDNGRIAVLPVVEEDLDDVRAELAAQIGNTEELCLVPVRYSTSELRAAQDLLQTENLYGSPLWVLGSGSGSVKNSVSVSVAVADRTTVETITALYDDPAILDIGSVGTILAGD